MLKFHPTYLLWYDAFLSLKIILAVTFSRMRLRAT